MAPKKAPEESGSGRKGLLGTMPTWKDKLDDSQIAALVSYIAKPG